MTGGCPLFFRQSSGEADEKFFYNTFPGSIRCWLDLDTMGINRVYPTRCSLLAIHAVRNCCISRRRFALGPDVEPNSVRFESSIYRVFCLLFTHVLHVCRNRLGSLDLLCHHFDNRTRNLGLDDLPSGQEENRASKCGYSEVTGTALKSSGNTVLNDHAYTLNVGNQRIAQTRTGVGYTNTVDYGYDPIGQLLSAVGKEISGTNRLQEQFGYAYDAGGNLKTRTNNALVQSFTVDTLNQLSTINRSGTLTVAGNTTSPATNVTVNSLVASLYADTTFAKAGFSVTDGTNSYTAIAQDSYGRLDTNSISVWLPASATYGYDLNGNLIFDGRKAFEYDDENQLVRVTRTNEWKTEFAYDGKMRMRVRKEYTWQSGIWNLQSETRFIYDGMLVVQERDGNNQPQVSYTRGRDLSGSFKGAGGIGGLLARTDLSAINSFLSTVFYHCDGNGNVTALMSTNGLIVAWYQYDPYGRTLAQSGPLADANCYRFSSKAWHEKSGLYYYGYRFYTPDLQRWVNRDPIGEIGGINLFAFIGNDPLGQVDMLGLYRRSGADFQEKAGCVLDCGRRKAALAADLAVIAAQAAERFYPNSLSGGIGDAFRHCLWSCGMAALIGQDCASKIAENHEKGGDRRREQTPRDREMDTKNNATGRELAKQAGKDGEQCGALCRQAADNGSLATIR